MRKKLSYLGNHMDVLLKTLFWTGLAVSFICIMAFTGKERMEMICTGLEIRIDNSGINGNNYFIDAYDIENAVLRQNGFLKGKPVSAVNLNAVERNVRRNTMVQEAEVYSTIDGKIRIDIEQKIPILRVVSYSGYGYYIDKSGGAIPLSAKYTARVPVVNGYFYKSDTLVQRHVYEVGKFIANDRLWKAMFSQIYVNTNREFELIPRVGNFRILLGDTAFMREKFNKLYLMYNRGLPRSGWNLYSQINLKFINQVVCTKR